MISYISLYIICICLIHTLSKKMIYFILLIYKDVDVIHIFHCIYTYNRKIYWYVVHIFRHINHINDYPYIIRITYLISYNSLYLYVFMLLIYYPYIFIFSLYWYIRILMLSIYFIVFIRIIENILICCPYISAY